MTDYKPGDRVLLVPGTEPIEAVRSTNGFGWFVGDHDFLTNKGVAMLGFTIQPMPLAEPPIGSRVRTGVAPWQEYERAEDGWRQAGGPLLRPDSRFKWVGDLERNVVAVGTPSFEWTEVSR